MHKGSLVAAFVFEDIFMTQATFILPFYVFDLKKMHNCNDRSIGSKVTIH